MKIASLFCCFALALAGCETTVTLPEPPHTPRVALLYTFSAAPQDSSFRELYDGRQLYISNSQRVFDSGNLVGRPDAAVELRDASGRVVERFRALGARSVGNNGYVGYYRPRLGFRPLPGQAYTLRATLPGLETAESTLTLPAPAVVESAAYAPRAGGGGSPQDFRGRLTVALRDDPAAANYYLAYARALDAQGQPGPWSPLEMDDDDQGSGFGIGQFQLSTPRRQYARLFPFADTDANGQRLTLAADVRFRANCFGGASCPPPAFIEVVVSTITADAYEFYLSRRRYDDSDGNPFAEPAPLTSNVRPGYGLFGGATDVAVRIRL